MTFPRSITAAFVLSLAFVAVAAAPSAAQQRALDHEDVLHWNTIGSPALSPDGAWLVYVLTAMEGDPVLTIRAAREGATPLTVRGSSPVFTSDSRFVVYEVPPVEAVVDSLRREGKRGDALPKDSVGVISLGGDGPEARRRAPSPPATSMSTAGGSWPSEAPPGGRGAAWTPRARSSCPAS